MKKVLFLVMTILALGAVSLLFVFDRKSENKSKNPLVVTAGISTTLVTERKIQSLIECYGAVIPAPGRSKAISLQSAVQIKSIFVTEGQKVSKGDKLISVDPSTNESMVLKKAQLNYNSTKKWLLTIRERFALKLVTKGDLIKAKQKFDDASVELKNILKRRVVKNITLLSESNGLISKIFNFRGAIVPAGNPLMEIVSNDNVELRLGVELEDIQKVKPNLKVEIIPVNTSSKTKITGRVRAISSSVNLSTRLIDVFVKINFKSNLMLNEYVRANILISSHQGLAVPTTSVISSKKGDFIYLVKNKRAKLCLVKKGIVINDYIEVSGKCVKNGDTVVKSGNYELEDGMLVRIEPNK